MEYKSIKFGELSAEEEVDKNPDLVISGFYDFKDVVTRVLNGSEFLILGNKGSGKSIVGEHLKATSGIQADKTQRFVSKFGMKDFPFKSFAKIIPGDEGPETKLPTAWQWALLVQVILSFKNDFGKSSEFDTEFNNAINNLTKIGILPSSTISDLARICGTNEFKVKIMSFELSGDLTPAKATDLMFSQVIDHLKGVVIHLQSPNKHFIVIDGLDDQLSEKNNQFVAIATLISVAGELNKLFREKNIPIKIVILCRKDIHSKLPGANKNKVGGYTVTLNWYEDQIEPKQKNIVKLAQFRAEKSGLKGDLFDKHFQAKYAGNKDAIEYLLENTRYTPRDFLRLLTEIQNFKSDFSAVSTSDIDRAVKKYSTDYFWPEIEDELDGYCERKDIAKLKQALIHYQRREFSFHDFRHFCDDHSYVIPNIEKMFEVMYDCGAISNRIENGKIFSKMRDGNDFNERQTISIHRGAIKALGLG
ncbi:MAG: hypothetical protein F9K35_00915 [Burkholderiaceae bacterium]|nr:MAG: hypothetical protein F9K35_00915 [Burkholderiaceae bacterium]